MTDELPWCVVVCPLDEAALRACGPAHVVVSIVDRFRSKALANLALANVREELKSRGTAAVIHADELGFKKRTK